MYVARIKNSNIVLGILAMHSYFKAKRNVFKAILITIAMAISLLLLFFKVPSLSTSVDAQSLSINTVKGAGIETSKIIDELNRYSLNATYVSEIKRSNFSVPGSLIALGGDNIQIYQYQSKEEATRAAQTYIAGLAENQWKSQTHLYTKGNTLIFYLGTRENILKTLDTVMADITS